MCRTCITWKSHFVFFTSNKTNWIEVLVSHWVIPTFLMYYKINWLLLICIVNTFLERIVNTYLAGFIRKKKEELCCIKLIGLFIPKNSKDIPKKNKNLIGLFSICYLAIVQVMTFSTFIILLLWLSSQINWFILHLYI